VRAQNVALISTGTLTEVEGSVQMTSIVKTSLDQLIFKLKKYFLPLLKKTSYLNE
jgi:hypothetical protein